MLIIICSGCQSKLKLNPNLAGRRLKCPKCGNAVSVPRTSGSSDQPSPEPEPQQQAAAPEQPVMREAPIEASPPPLTPTINLDTSTPSSRTSRRRKKRSSVGIWLPLVVVLIGAAVGLWQFLPSSKPPQIVTKKLPDQTIAEGRPLKLMMPVATNSGQTTQLKIVKAPPGAILDQSTREFHWTPTEADGPGEFEVTVHLIQGSATIAATFGIVVTEEDSAPVFNALESFKTKPLEPMTISVSAKDPDLPTVAVTYSLVRTSSDEIAGASIDPQSGELTFSPTDSAAGENVTIRVRAKEVSDAALSTETDILVQVAEFEDPVRQFRAELGKRDVVYQVVERSNATALPFSGTVTHLTINDQSVDVFRYDTLQLQETDMSLVNEQVGKIGDVAWEDPAPLNIFANDQLIVTAVGRDTTNLQLLASVLNRPAAVVQRYEAPAPIVKQTPAMVAALSPIYEERVKGPGKPRKLFTTASYNDVRTSFANDFAETHDAEIRSGLGDDYDEVMEWFAERVDLKEELFTAIRPDVDSVSSALQLFNEIRKAHPKQIDRYGSLAIACSVVWDNNRGIYQFAGHAKRTHSSMPDALLAGLENFRYFVDAENVMQGRAQFVPWEFLTHLVNHKTPVQERVWAAQAYVPTRQMFGKCYADVPYDTEMLQTSSRVCKLDGKEYNLPNIRQFGGVCSMQADFAARVGKSIGVPAAYVSGSGKFGGAHAWVMWVELQAVTQRSIKFSLESHGRYRGDNYYVGRLKDPQTGRGITDRLLELRLHQVGMDAMAKRHSDRLMMLYPQMAEEFAFDFQSHLEYLSGAVALNPWSESAWTALSQLSLERTFGRDEHKTMTALLNQLFINFAGFPDFTLTVFDDLISFEKDEAKRIAYYYQLLEFYAAAKRPDLGFTSLLRLSEILEQEERSGEAIQALAVAIQKYPDEGQYVPKMLDRLETLATSGGEADQTLAVFYASFLPKIPQTRGSSPSKYCIQMYERAVPIFERAGQPQLAQTYQTGAAQMKASGPQ